MQVEKKICFLLLSWDRLPQFEGTNGTLSRGEVVPKVDLSELGCQVPRCGCWPSEARREFSPWALRGSVAEREVMESPPDAVDYKR